MVIILGETGNNIPLVAKRVLPSKFMQECPVLDYFLVNTSKTILSSVLSFQSVSPMALIDSMPFERVVNSCCMLHTELTNIQISTYAAEHMRKFDKLQIMYLAA